MAGAVYILNRISDLVAGLVILRLVVSLHDLDKPGITEIELDPARALGDLGKPEDFTIETPLPIQIIGNHPDPARPVHGHSGKVLLVRPDCASTLVDGVLQDGTVVINRDLAPPTLCVMAGLPAARKTTHGRQLAMEHRTLRLTADE